ncbi:uroporphyrinogen-III synthase [Muriicola marianensis]|uniref:Uroporphyrinogen-III synthase n=1 Tax=Muriicola marianensis TaxID=1324801 RepID=A0ABQ1QW04_9FLAO|nr:uroporphyrinogen-III synthase [Muriicola marianensis]GGD48989.1 uroporphyrinogen III methyltransferase [Muriicola marianensis]
MNSVLSTRNLSSSQLALLAKSGIGMECYDAILIKLLKAELPEGFDEYIFTSKNGVKGYLKNRVPEAENQKKITCYCVGEKTQAFLEEKGLFVAKMTQNSRELGDFLVKNDKKGPFLVFTGNRNRPELGSKLEEHQIPFREVLVYETHLNPKKIEKNFQILLFYSPSGVQSFVQVNDPKDETALCIGETTAREARKHFRKVVVADKPTTDNVIEKLIENFPTLSNA